MKNFVILLAILNLASCDLSSNTPLSFEGNKAFNLEEVLLKSSPKPLLVYFTAFGCSACRTMEEKVLSSKTITKTIQENYTLVSLIVDDRTKANKENWKHSKIVNKVLKTVGTLNGDFQIQFTQTSSQPTFVIVNQQKEIVSIRGYTNNVDTLSRFLEEPLN
ncbi:MAG: thioredoxin family protein [Saprospiraceae bacterium]|nr:thioredoxin family protein [Saprospiraceae bacterium]